MFGAFIGLAAPLFATLTAAAAAPAEHAGDETTVITASATRGGLT